MNQTIERIVLWANEKTNTGEANMATNIELAAMAAFQNACDTVFVEKSSEMTLENFVWLASASVEDVVEGGSYGEMTGAEMRECKEEAKAMANNMFHLYSAGN